MKLSKFINENIDTKDIKHMIHFLMRYRTKMEISDVADELLKKYKNITSKRSINNTDHLVVDYKVYPYSMTLGEFGMKLAKEHGLI